ncbi:unnamed protein product [Peniophora sp. CBMAI 1063]|nr:unnamed protein product [Peniophora sp. CBMAI 1063]
MPSCIEVTIFAGQGTGHQNSELACKQALACVKEPAGALLLAYLFDTFRAELASLKETELDYADIDVGRFDRPETLLGLQDESPSCNPIITGTRLLAQQVITYLVTCFLPSTSSPSSTHAPANVAVGFSSGILAAYVAATSATTPEYINNAVSAFRLAFWVGVRAQSARREMLESAGVSKDDARPWALVFSGWSKKEDAYSFVDQYNLQATSSAQVYVTAVIDSSSVTISGRGDILATFATQAPAGITVHKTSMDALYHVPVLADVKTRVLADVARREVRLSDFGDLKFPIACTATGERLSVNSGQGRRLVDTLVDLILIQPVNWDRVVQSLAGETQDARLRLVNIGPGASLTKRATRGLPRDSFDIVDMSTPRTASPAAPRQEPIAVVGMAVDMPGSPSTTQLWKVLEQGINTISEIPSHRFKVSDYNESSTGNAKRTMKAHTGNFLDAPDGFDAQFFMISPREARSMDPQARVLLHTAYEALEDAGYVPDATPSFSRETFGCYVGVATGDYIQNLRKDIDVYYSTGTLRAFLSGRISYVFKWGGPSVVIDTACSGSMVSIYQACRALTNRDCNAALAGGVNVVTSPDMFLGLDRGHFLSPTGQCKAFDASADGYSRSEGCGVFVLKRLSDALAENDNILGVIRGIEVNQSGLSHSITHPHAPTQAKLFKQLLDRTGVHAHRVSVVEAHGTGTQAGDPNELESIRGVFCAGRTADNPLHVTSIKANIGHLEAASGAAGLAKLLLMLQHRTIPRVISLNNLNPRIKNLEADHTIIDREQIHWRPTREGETRMALLNNFGAAGSNGALLLEEHVSRRSPLTASFVFGISAKTSDALIRLRDTYVDWLCHPDQQDTPLADIAYTATARRILYDHRIAVTASSKEELVEKLKASTPVLSNAAPGKVAFVFSGQGSQYRGMGTTLYQTSPLCREIFDDCHSLLVSAGLPGVLQVLCPGEISGDLSREEEFEANQPAIFVLEYALARLWMSWGVQPGVVVGHSLGEYAAHVVAGVLSLKDALMLVARRARLMLSLCVADDTSMLAVNLSQSELEKTLASSPKFAGVSIACYNSPSDLVVAGPLDALRALKTYITENVKAKSVLLSVPYGYHSRAMDPILSELASISKRVDIQPPKIAVVSNVLGEVVMPGVEGVFSPEYYTQHCSQPVQFEKGVKALSFSPDFQDLSAFVEIGPHPTTLPMLKAHPLVRGDIALVPSLRKNHEAWATLSSTLAQFYSTTCPIRWRDVFAHASASVTHLPTYPWSKAKFWVAFEEDSHGASSDPESQRANSVDIDLVDDFSMLHRWMQAPALGNDPTAVIATPISLLASAITGHRVGGAALCPASVYHELALAGIVAVSKRLGLSFDESHVILREVEYTKPLVYAADVQRTVFTSITAMPDGSGSWRVSSRSGDGSEVCHSLGAFERRASTKTSGKFARLAPVLSRQIAAVEASLDAETFSTRTAYEVIFPRVVDYSKEYHTLRSLRVSSDGMEGYAVVQLPRSHERGGFVVHPVFMDTLLHIPGFAANLQGGVADAFICHQVEKITVLPDLVDTDALYGVYFRNVWLPEEKTTLAEAFVVELAGERRIVGHLKGMHFRRVRLAGLKRSLALAAGESSSPAPPYSPPRPRQIAPTLSQVLTSSRASIDVEAIVKQVVAQTCDIANVDTRADLSSYGIDSLMSIEMLHKLQDALPDAALDTDTLAACTTVAQIVQEVTSRLSSPESPASPVTPPSMSSETTKAESQVELGSAYVRSVLATALGISTTDLSDDTSLDALGLDSLTTIEVMATLQKSLAVALPESLFDSATTVKDALNAVAHAMPDATKSVQHVKILPAASPMTATVDVVSPASQPRLERLLRLNEIPVPVQAGSGMPLFLVHDGSGIVNYLERVTPLGRPLWGFNNPHFLDGQPWLSLEAMAGSYAEHALKVSGGSGNFILGGWSFGGVVAFEAARQLRARGSPVRGVLLIDSPAPRAHIPLSDALIAAVTAAAGRSSSSDLSRLVATQFASNSRLLGAYASTALDGPFEERVVLLRSSEGYKLAGGNVPVPSWLSDREDANVGVKGWEDMLGRKIKVLPIPGNHFEVFAPQNAAQVSKAIAEAARYLEEQM